jgi:hypothetical protein
VGEGKKIGMIGRASREIVSRVAALLCLGNNPVSPYTAEEDENWLRRKTAAEATEWKIRFFEVKDKGFRGTITSGTPEEDAAGSRQVRRYALRCIAFNRVTERYWRGWAVTRRLRRSMARSMAVDMYREAQASMKEGMEEA